MIVAAAFVLAAAVGALSRAEAGRRWNRHGGFPYGTVVVNVTGSFLLGLAHHISGSTLTIVGVGGLGAFTTFSSFARDTVSLIEARQIIRSVTYVLVTVILGVVAAAIGTAL